MTLQRRAEHRPGGRIPSSPNGDVWLELGAGAMIRRNDDLGDSSRNSGNVDLRREMQEGGWARSATKCHRFVQ